MIRCAISVFVIALLLGCGAPPAVDEGEPDITGIVTAVQRTGAGDRLGVIRVETVPDDEAGTPKASVTVTSGSTITGAENADVAQAFAELQEGARVHVWFTGPVMESYPVQATAGRIELEASAAGRQ